MGLNGRPAPGLADGFVESDGLRGWVEGKWGGLVSSSVAGASS